MKDSFEWKRQRLTEGFPPSSSWSPWPTASPALCIDNERFKEQLRQVQAYLNVLKTKGDIAADSRGRNQFPICGFNFSKMVKKISTEGTCKLPPWWALPGHPAPPGSTPWLIKVLRLIHKQRDTDLSFIIRHVMILDGWSLLTTYSARVIIAEAEGEPTLPKLPKFMLASSTLKCWPRSNLPDFLSPPFQVQVWPDWDNNVFVSWSKVILLIAREWEPLNIHTLSNWIFNCLFPSHSLVNLWCCFINIRTLSWPWYFFHDRFNESNGIYSSFWMNVDTRNRR